MEFSVISNRSLTSRLNGLIKTAEKQREEYWNLMFNAVKRSYDHNDTSHVNKAVQAAKAVGRYKATVSILKTVVPYAFDAKEQVFYGKRKKGMFEKLNDQYEQMIKDAVAAQLEADSAVPSDEKKAADFRKRLINATKAALKHDMSAQVVESIVRDVIKEVVTEADKDAKAA